MLKVIRANIRTGSVVAEKLKEDYKYFGNRGLVAKVMADEVNPKCDPLGPENKLIVSTGLLAGTAVTTAHRLSVGAKSPLTGGIKEANSGGIVAAQLARHGIKMIIIEDIPADDTWRMLHIDAGGNARLLPAGEYVGMNNYELTEKLQERFGHNIASLTIGTAGERLSNIASLQATDLLTRHPSRAAARGGLGAVAGSKKLKAIVIEKAATRYQFPYVDKAVFDAANKRFIDFCTGPDFPLTGLTATGTVGITEVVAALGVLPVRNFTASIFPQEKLVKINAKAWLERANKYGGKTTKPCQPGCLIRCSNVVKYSNGETITSGLEYETFAMCGPNWDVDNIEFIAEIDRFCDDMGIDTIDFGNTIAVLMDVGKIPWGDQEAVKKITAEIKEGKTELSRLLLMGTETVGKNMQAKRIPTVKGQGFPAYDPRNAKGMGITYATSTMGADHTSGYALDKTGDNIAKEGKIELSRRAQIVAATCDNLICSFLFPTVAHNPDIFPYLMQGAYGGEWDVERVLSIGEETLKIERAWNAEAGFTPEQDRLPEFMYTEPSPATGATFNFSDEELQTLLQP